jgi:hypothetical protein
MAVCGNCMPSVNVRRIIHLVNCGSLANDIENWGTEGTAVNNERVSKNYDVNIVTLLQRKCSLDVIY